MFKFKVDKANAELNIYLNTLNRAHCSIRVAKTERELIADLTDPEETEEEAQTS